MMTKRIKKNFKSVLINYWINILTEEILEKIEAFRYRTRNRGIDLIYTTFNQSLKISVRYKKIRAGDSLVKKLIITK